MIAPRICHIPPSVSGAGADAIDLAVAAGIVLDPWQAFVLENSLGETADGSWSAFEVGVCVPRQNGKSETALARMLAGLILLEEPLQIFSSNLFDSAREIHRRLASVLGENADLSRRVKAISKGNGLVGIELKNGCRVRFRARGSGGGRGLSPSCLLFDESMFLSAAMYADLVPAVSAQRQQQIWLLGSTPDQATHSDSIVFARMRERALSGDPGALAWFEWSVPFDRDGLTEARAADPDLLMQANPAIETGRLTLEQIARERQALDLPTFATERCGAGDWPRGDGTAGVIPEDLWRACEDNESDPLPDGLCFAVDVAASRTSVAIAVAGLRDDKRPHVELVDVCSVPDAPVRVAELVGRHRPAAVVADATGPTAALLPALDALSVRVTLTSASEHAQAASLFYDRVMARELRYRRPTVPPGDGLALQLDRATLIATKRPLGDGGFGWSRKGLSASIAPLVAATLAVWGAETLARPYDGPLLEVFI